MIEELARERLGFWELRPGQRGTVEDDQLAHLRARVPPGLSGAQRRWRTPGLALLAPPTQDTGRLWTDIGHKPATRPKSSRAKM